jgi:hypothetical protein
VVLLGAADALREKIGAARPPDYRRWYDELLAAAAATMPVDAVEASLAAGRELSAEAAVTEATR